MEVQSPTQPETIQQPSTPPVPVIQNSKPLIIAATLVFLLMAGGLVYLGYQNYQLQQRLNQLLEQQTNQIQPTPTPTSTQPSPTTSTVSSSTPKPAKKLTYSLPANWKTLTDTNGRLEVGYDATRYEASAKSNQVDLSGKWVGTQGTNLHRLGWNKNFYLTAYNGGSRHTELYKIWGVTSTTSDWKSLKYYSEKEYLYNGWSCLVINGVDISQYPVAWGYCPISSNEALVLAFDGYDWSEIEQQISAVRLLK